MDGLLSHSAFNSDAEQKGGAHAWCTEPGCGRLSGSLQWQLLVWAAPWCRHASGATYHSSAPTARAPFPFRLCRLGEDYQKWATDAAYRGSRAQQARQA